MRTSQILGSISGKPMSISGGLSTLRDSCFGDRKLGIMTRKAFRQCAKEKSRSAQFEFKKQFKLVLN